MTHTPAIALATEIASQVASLTLGTNIFHSTVRAPDARVPVDCVFVWEDAGPTPLRTMSEPDEIRHAVLHVQVRDTSYADGTALSKSIMNSIRAKAIATYLDLENMNSGPRGMGQDSDGRHHFGLVFVLTYQEP